MTGTEGHPSNSWPRVLVALAVMFVVYQASEGLQTVIAPGNPIGPVLMLVALAIAWPLGRWLGWRGYDAFGLQIVRGWPLLLIGGVLLAGLAKLAALALSPLAGAGTLANGAPVLTPAFIAVALLTTFAPSVAEDILTRGFLLGAVPVRLGAVAYVVSSAVLYTANHVWRFDWGATEQLRLFCLGLPYGAAAWRWRSLWGAVALHWGWNLSDVLAGQVFTLDGGSTDALRLVSGSVHLAMLAIILCLPSRRGEPDRQL
jgi:membrane protease YdiL (CAAX protease family)